MMARRLFAVAVAGLLVFLGSSGASAAPSVSVLHSFAGPEGEVPSAPLVQGGDGLLYGVARYGGDFTVMPPDGGGTIFRTDGAGNVTTLHVFSGEDGAVPTGLTRGRDGKFYGTTVYGGVPGPDSLNPGPGTIFRIDASGNFTRLFVLPGWERGYRPGPLVQGDDGALYGTAVGGSSLYARFPGVVFRFDPADGSYRILHTFTIADGRDPTGRLFQAADGFFYGTTNQGGAFRCGVVYKANAAGDFALLHSFDFNDGCEPKAGVSQASDGFFYGTTEKGSGGYGEVFRMDAAGNLTVLHRFGPYSAGGLSPDTNPVEVSPGVFYGVTPLGGTVNPSYGIVYRMESSGSTSVVHEFSGPDGIAPHASLTLAGDGMLYGSTSVGGAYGLGTLFRLAPTQTALLPTLLSLTPSQYSVVGGTAVSANVELSWAAPAGGAVVSLSSDAGLVSVPASVTVPAGATRATFPITTGRTKRTRVATITATYHGSRVTTTLTVTR
jgi:uncharacterized repeat protein (TIGR03803 family)